MLEGIKNFFASDDPDPRCSAIVVAAGKGSRMQSELKKQFLPLLGMPVLSHTLEAIEKSDMVSEIILVVSEDDILTAKDIVAASDLEKVTKIVAGGKNRAESVSKGLAEVSEDAEIIMIHDGVRPCVSEAMVEECIKNAKEHGASALGVKPKNTIKRISKDGFITETIDREELVEIQTPQCFQAEIIKKAYEDFDSSATDDCALVEALGVKIHITEGSYANLKLTTREDLLMLSALIDAEFDEE
ncbi:MAG: 2-C-methyl-D-erythritol 4-phosphate cytidylyltransferase [Clostridia bacterium]|nr:2-C-methyl-D-erythritol 4-phosphate cytidylyltransferase [Clostridia bacterium]